ncbi:hypothetical protein [Pseudonocardia sp. McavD-2-B]|uniref:hypothetical protein n=1 Tax=Pseudonocardia sp. McavD-2-B TaxID=2954499 RepID=UPI002097ED68|nr:hypothetical protein [Pseudonocardia sp. McavD-2-B]MCO7195050.1 hypothetical protein [Pseudonocardia sp. McavD-2-B]
MRKSVRTLLVSAMAVPMSLGVAGMAFADEGDFDQDQSQTTEGTVTGEQGAATEQGNSSFAPITQINPALNASDILGISDFANEDSEGGDGQSVVQDNSIESSNDQGNASSTEQSQKSVLEQLTSFEG